MGQVLLLHLFPSVNVVTILFLRGPFFFHYLVSLQSPCPGFSVETINIGLYELDFFHHQMVKFVRRL